MKNRLFAALIGFSLVSEFVLLSVSEVGGMEAVQNERYIETRFDLYRQSDGSKYFLKDGRRFLKDNFNVQELDDWSFAYGANNCYRGYWNSTTLNKAKKFVLYMCKYLQKYTNDEFVIIYRERLKRLTSDQY